MNNSPKVGTWELTAIFIAFGVTLNTFAVGSAQAGHMSFGHGVLMILIGWVGLAVFGTVSGNIGYETGYRAPQIFSAVFGTVGYKIPSILAALSMLGLACFDYWYVGQALMNMFPSLGSGAFYIGIIFIALVACLGALKDITSLKWLSSATIPIALVLFFVILFVTISRGGGMAVLMNYQPPMESVPLLIGANVMISIWSSAMPSFADFASQAKARKCVLWAIPLGMLGIAFQYFVGQMGTYAFEAVSDFTSLAAALGGGMGLVCNLFTLFAQANTVPAATLFMTAHFNTSLKVPRTIVIIVQPIIGAILAIAMFLGADISILSSFGSIIGFIFAPLLGITFAEYYVIGRRSFVSEDQRPAFSFSSTIVLVLGFILGIILDMVLKIQFPTFIVLFVGCFCLHLILRKVAHMK